MTWFLDLRADSAGGNPAREVTVRENNDIYLSAKGLVSAIHGKHVLLATHGFNVNRSDGIDSLSKWANLVNLGADSIFVGVLWPGDSCWAPVVDYPFEGSEAIMSGELLAPFLDEYFVKAASISFASHSLGARMVLETISHLKLNVRRLTIMAGAINDDCLLDEYQGAASKIEKISLLASHEDYVLKLAFPIGNLISELISSDHPYWKGALGLDGPAYPLPNNLHTGWQIPDDWDYGHLDYLGGGPPPFSGPANLPTQAPNVPCPKPTWSACFVSTRFL